VSRPSLAPTLQLSVPVCAHTGGKDTLVLPHTLGVKSKWFWARHALLRGVVRVRMAEQKEVTDHKLVDDAVKFCKELQRSVTGEEFTRKMRGYTFSAGSVYPLEKEGGAWSFEMQLNDVWGEFLIELMGKDYAADLIQKKKATALSYALLHSGIEPVVRRGLTVIGEAPSGTPQVGGVPAPTSAPAFDEVGGGGRKPLGGRRRKSCVVKLRLPHKLGLTAGKQPVCTPWEDTVPL
jgi:hypothetical protein